MVESLCVKIRGKAKKAGVLAGVYYGSPSQDDDTDVVFYKESREISRSVALRRPSGRLQLPSMLTGVLVLLFRLCWRWRKRIREVDSNDEDSSSSSTDQEEEEEQEEEESEGVKAMATTNFLTWLVQSIILNLPMVGDELDEATRERMQQHAEQLSQEMARLLQELEQKSQEQRIEEQSGFSWGALLFAALQQWQFWAIVGVLVLLFGLCWWLRKRSRQPASSSKQGSSGKKADKEEQEEKPSVALAVGRIAAKRLLDPPQSFTMLEELVDELLRICRKLSRNSFMPRLKPAIGVSSALEGWSSCADDAVYCLLVPLKPPRGHTFHLELGTAEEMLARNCSLRVELKCTCTRERLVEDMLCFLHHPKEELRKNQGPSLLGTLCTGPYLDMEKTTRWFQILVKAAWVVLPQSRHCRLTVLPSRRSCKLQLTNASDSTLLIEMIFGLQQDDSDTFLKWRRRDFLLRLQDIMQYLCCCLEEKRLNHFFFGNERLPEEIVLPPAFQMAKPVNLFRRLAQDPAAHAEALRELDELQDRLTRLLIYGC
ncbi:inositol 1,4,5-trisphosphate receptor-interacting protein-like 1 [Theristicus caerulescens]